MNIIVKHFPVELSKQAVETFLARFGALDVKSFQRGPLTGSAFARFRDPISAESARVQINGMRLLDKTLVAEVVREKSQLVGDMGPSAQAAPRIQPVPGIAPPLGIHHPIPTDLEYKYPEPTRDILRNMMHTIAAVPRLYTQVLHLMNKMNLPPPFGPTVHPRVSLGKRSRNERDEDDPSNELLRDLDSEESELSDSEVMRSAAERAKERSKEHAAKRQQQQQQIPVQIETAAPAVQVRRNVISLSEIVANRLPEQELLRTKGFENYAAGEENRIVFVKNLPRKVSQETLEYIFGRYFETREALESGLSIKLMEGRLVGQGFMTYTSLDHALRAVHELNGFVLEGKPLMVMFGKQKSAPLEPPAPPPLEERQPVKLTIASSISHPVVAQLQPQQSAKDRARNGIPPLQQSLLKTVFVPEEESDEE